MKIHLYALAFNEEVILPFFLKYYSDFCDKIVIYDNESTDRTPEIVRSFPNTELRSWSSNNQIDENLYLNIKNQAYKESRGIADWVIVGDADEFIFHPNLSERLQHYTDTGITLPKVVGYEMVPNCELDPNVNLPFVYQNGTRASSFDKRMIFNPKLDIQFVAGCHGLVGSPSGIVESSDHLYLMHYKKLNLPYYVNRHTLLGTRLSESNRRNHWGFHYIWSPEQMTAEYNQVLSASGPIF
jgi:glycosyltransferase involved in cell wall biosynthesis